MGDVGVIHNVVGRKVIDKPQSLDFDNMSFRELFNVALECGFDVRDLIAVHSCDKHSNMHFLGGREMPQGMSLAENCVYCKKCWQFFRDKKI